MKLLTDKEAELINTINIKLQATQTLAVSHDAKIRVIGKRLYAIEQLINTAENKHKESKYE